MVLLHNLALTVSAAGRPDEAEAHFDQAIEWERPLMRALARSGKADWLAGQGRVTEAVALLEQLTAEPWTTWGERDAFVRQIVGLQGQRPSEPDRGLPADPAPEPQRKRWLGGRG